MQTILTSVASAAVISGDLIIGLSDGSIINCGRVQGPIGLTGDQGPMGATGRSGSDGNTIHTVQGTPDTALGKDGDFAINVKIWEIYGPRAGGAWGSGTPLRGNKRNGGSDQKDNIFGNNAPSEGGGGKAYNTSNLPLTGLGRVTAPGGNIIPDGLNLTYQSNANKWIVDSLQALDVALPIKKVDALPAEGAYEGDMVFMAGGLHVWVDGQWEAIGGGEAGKESTPFVDWHQFKVIERTDRYDYDPLFDTNPIAQTAWEYQIDILGAGDAGFLNVVDLSDSIKTEIGWYGSMSVSHLRLNKTVEQGRIYGSAKVRFKITTELNGVENVEYSCPLPAWQSGECPYTSSIAALTERVEEGEEKQDQVVAAIQQIQVQGAQWALHVDNIDADQITQNDQLDALSVEQNKIKLDLEELQVTKGSVARYKITATNIGAAARNGELYVMSPIAADVQAMSFAPFDLNGQPIKPCNPGDIIELVEAVALANVGEVCRYRIVSGDSNALTVEYLSGTNNFEVDETQEVYIYPQNEAGVSKDYVDDSLAGKLNNAGANDLSDGTDWKVRQQNAAGSNKTLLQIKAGELGVYNLKEPTQSHHAATKAYVDAKPSGGGGGVSASRPPGLKFNVSIVNLPDGYFNWWTNNSTNNQHLELATTDKDGIAWGTNTCREDVRYSDKIPFTIWEVSNNAWKMKVTGTLSRIDFHPDRALCYVSSKTALNGGNFVNGAGPYYITISGLF